jgi:tetratricopeptide (TPR) repeat protein
LSNMTAVLAFAACLILSALSFEGAAKDRFSITATDAAVDMDHQEEEDAAVRLCVQGSYAKAEALFQRILTVKEKTLGASHPALAATLGSFAWCCFQRRRHAEAVVLFKRALAIEEKALCRDHPSLANTLDSLAAVHVEQGRYKEAEALYRRALALREKILGERHSDVATSLNNLAVLRYVQGRSAEAAPLLLRALAILKERLPAGHPKIKLYQQNYDEMKQMAKRDYKGQLE